eukprot:m.91161 g.91161  ORF g.91161 m.91161 type:complete len:212 (-) comp14898_c0_seq1:1284-1919(-)
MDPPSYQAAVSPGASAVKSGAFEAPYVTNSAATSLPVYQQQPSPSVGLQAQPSLQTATPLPLETPTSAASPQPHCSPARPITALLAFTFRLPIASLWFATWMIVASLNLIFATLFAILGLLVLIPFGACCMPFTKYHNAVTSLVVWPLRAASLHVLPAFLSKLGRWLWLSERQTGKTLFWFGVLVFSPCVERRQNSYNEIESTTPASRSKV